MKKILSAVLAASMVASMGVSAFAAARDNNAVAGVYGGGAAFLYNAVEDSKNNITGVVNIYPDAIPYGTTLYYAFQAEVAAEGGDDTVKNFVHESDAVKSISVRQSWEMGREFVDGISIVKKKVTNRSKNATAAKYDTNGSETYFYFLALELKESTSDDIEDVIGELTLKKSSGGDEWAFSGTDHEITLPINLEVGYEEKTDDLVESDYTLQTFTEDSENYITFDASDVSYFIVDTCDQDSLVCKFDTKYNAEITAKYPNAYLDFFNGYGLTFNKIGEMNLGTGDYNDEEGYLYELKNGTLVPVSAEYDEYEGVYRFYTRTIGSYVISDVELDVKADEKEEEKEDVVVTPPVVKPNPGTGAIA